MHGVGFELPLGDWFEFEVPKTKIPAKYLERILRENSSGR
jgi:hypothetical protein